MTPTNHYLLDTSVLVAAFRNDPVIIAHLNQYQGSYYLASIGAGELYYGAYHATNPQRDVAQADTLVQSIPVLSCDATTAKVYGLFRQQLSAAGQLIPENDLWIAATAYQNQLIVATRDAHFQRIHGLLVDM